MTATVGELIGRQRIVVCCGTGGVGKTTVAAVIAVEAARAGRDAVVVTIDPAKRLADALGLEELSNVPREIDRARWSGDPAAPGRLSALMLDTKSTFDGLVKRYAEEDDQAERIFANRFYRSISGALSGAQEYMAMEMLHELHEEGGYDLIVVDTPPTRHALDFLDAPRRLTRMLDNRIFRLLMMPTRAYLRVASVAVQAFLRTVSRVVGTEVIDDIVAFFRAFEGMEAGFRERAARVLELLEADSTSFLLVTSPRRDAVTEAEYFAARLAEMDTPVDALVVNRVHPRFGEGNAAALRSRATTLRALDGAGSRLACWYENLADFREVAEHEHEQFAPVIERMPGAAVAFVPYLAQDVHDFDALHEVGTHLFERTG